MARRKEEEAIDEVIDTLYALDVQGYRLPGGVGKGEALTEAINRIHRTIARLDRDKTERIEGGKEYKIRLEDEAQRRIKDLGRFMELPEHQRGEVVRRAKEEGISLEQAYRAVAGSGK